jgi:hypothetical protein
MMIRAVLIAGLTLQPLTVAPRAAVKFDPFAGPKPIAVFTEINPWLMVIGSDTPRVAVYENGDVIFTKKIGDAYAYHYKKLAPPELSVLERRWQAMLTLTPPKDGYEISYATDQATAVFYLRQGDKTFATRVYGLDCRGTVPVASNLKPDAKPPAALYDVHRTLCVLDFSDSQPWVPKYIEVMFWDYSYAPNQSVAWPKTWAGFDSERAIKRGEAYSIFLDGTQLPALRSFLKTQREKGAVELAGKKWAVDFRYTFPSEPMWRGGRSR